MAVGIDQSLMRLPIWSSIFRFQKKIVCEVLILDIMQFFFETERLQFH